MPRLAGGKDIITQPLYDTQAYPTGGATQLVFFGTPKGQGTTLFGTGAKNLVDTNMEAAGMLPSPWTHEIHTIQVSIFALTPATSEDVDQKIILARSALELNIGSKWWLRIPCLHTPAGAGVWTGSAGTAVVAGSVANGQPDPRAVFILSRPITILEQESFNVTLSILPGTGVTVQQLVRVYLGGELSRAIQ